MPETPRSGRPKKKSHLSRLAEQSGNTPRDSSGSSREMASPSRQYGSKESIGRTLGVNKTKNIYYADSDEGVEMTINRRKKSGTLLRVKTSDVHNSLESDSDDDSPSKNVSSINKCNKQHRNQNSDSDDMKWQSNNRREHHSSSRHQDGANHRPQSRIGYDDDDDTEEDGNDVTEFRRGRFHKQSQKLTEQLNSNYTSDQLTTLYKDELERRESEHRIGQDDEVDNIDGLNKIKHPKCSNQSPEHHPFNRRITSTSMISTITSRSFMNRNEILEPFAETSQDSVQSTSILPMISTKEARNRSYLIGSATANGSILGAEELERYFPDRKMRIFIGTWNMCQMKVPSCLDDFILPDTSEFVHDMYVIGTQESCADRREWEIKLQETLGPQHVLLHSAAHGALYLCIFIRRDLIWYTTACEEDFVTTRAGPTGIKTKGAIGVSFSVFGTSFLFLNTHLSPHDGHLNNRIADFHKICSSLQLPKSQSTNSLNKDVTARFDCVFWLGDLNFRMKKSKDHISCKLKAIESAEIPDYDDLMHHDELSIVRNEALAFVDFQEGRIKFKPTYKYDIGTDEFDTSKKMRTPSYTDRILFRCRRKNNITCLYYDSAQAIKLSDHKPVYGMYEVNLRPGRDNVPLSAGQFNKVVWLEGNRRRALSKDMSIRTEKQSTVCSIQ